MSAKNEMAKSQFSTKKCVTPNDKGGFRSLKLLQYLIKIPETTQMGTVHFEDKLKLLLKKTKYSTAVSPA